ncbi:putative lipid II flippase FtsW [Gracilibacillus xinjiangensis]|uniref:Probable peptidoglycan glycosyltransferase FtsW n=1 Tax=Gracilibacillus xinjiangensis TaxID=1193282 RepID=A0ABV8WU15_9BACI
MRFFKRIDLSLLIGLAFFISFGIMMVYSASFPYATIRFEDTEYYFHRQLFWAGLGFLLLILAMIIPYKVYRKLVPILIMLTMILLFLVLVPHVGVERNFSTRWISIGGILFQPVELAKVTMLIYFAYFYSRKEEYIDNFKKGVAPPLIILAIVFALILKQPDLGSSILIVFSCGMILFFTKIPFRHLFLLMMTAVIGVLFFAITSPYRLERITSFIAPFDDMEDSGYQLINSYISISTGGITGLGLGNSVQKLGYLPEAHTDFIMSIIAEELGFIGVLLVIGFYFFFFTRGLLIARRAADSFGKLLAFGITFQIITQAFINLGAVLGFLPITGIPLPFVSYGGSSLVIMMISAGILLNISYRKVP